MNQQLFLNYISDVFQKKYPQFKIEKGNELKINLYFHQNYHIQIDLTRFYDPNLLPKKLDQISNELFMDLDHHIDIINRQLHQDSFEIKNVIVLIQSKKQNNDMIISDPIIEGCHDISIYYAQDHEHSIFYFTKHALHLSGSSIDDLRRQATVNTKKMQIIDPKMIQRISIQNQKFELEFYHSNQMYNAQFLRSDFYLSKPSMQALICFLDVYSTAILYLPETIQIQSAASQDLKKEIYDLFKDLYAEYQKDNDPFPFVLFMKKNKSWELF